MTNEGGDITGRVEEQLKVIVRMRTVYGRRRGDQNLNQKMSHLMRRIGDKRRS